MKKGFTIFLTLLFFVSTVGLTINTHLCSMSKKASITFFIKKSCCGEKGEKDGCCHNKTRIVKITDTFSASPSLAINASLPYFLLHFASIEINSCWGFSIPSFFSKVLPPLLYKGISIPVLYRSIRI